MAEKFDYLSPEIVVLEFEGNDQIETSTSSTIVQGPGEPPIL